MREPAALSSRRDFTRTLGLALGGAATLPLLAAERRLKIGHTGITWGFRPDDAGQAIPDVASLGYWGFESFGNVLESWEAKGGLGAVLEKNKLQLVSAYCGYNMLDPTKLKDETAKMVRWGSLIKKYGGTVSVLGPSNVRRNTYDFAANKAAIVTSLNEVCKALADIGITGVLHQHTGTCVETRDEVYAVMEKVDTKYVKFGPDVGQLQKGGADPVKIVADFVSLIEHVHLKDWDGGPSYEGYCPLGRGKVDLAKVLDLLEKSKIKAMIMVELDPPLAAGVTARETAVISKAYLEKAGYKFRS
jgi:inosose dehydratase